MAAPVAAARAACAVLVLGAWLPIASAQEVPPPAYQLAAQRAGIPSPVLFAVALQESGARLHGRLIPWPWTLNVAGRAERYATRAEACAGLRRARIALPVALGPRAVEHDDVGRTRRTLPDSPTTSTVDIEAATRATSL